MNIEEEIRILSDLVKQKEYSKALERYKAVKDPTELEKSFAYQHLIGQCANELSSYALAEKCFRAASICTNVPDPMYKQRNYKVCSFLSFFPNDYVVLVFG